MTSTEVLNRIDRLFGERGGTEYHGEKVTQLEHALQCAALAEADNQPPEVIVAAFLHDIGHLLHAHGEDYLDHGINDKHEDLGARFLSCAFSRTVTEPIRLHVPAKRYLCAAKPGYLALLSPGSVRSLELQGGPMNPDEVCEFEMNPYFYVAAKVREYDDGAKVVGMVTPPFAHFRTYLERCLHADSA
jgi:phosphonate degradation associated HDIG domain protein